MVKVLKKDIYKCMLLLFVGIIVTVLIYPLCHEMGHVSASLLVGAEVKDFTLIPYPNILCDVSGICDGGIIIIGLGGMFISPLLAAFLPKKIFVFWYVRFLLLGISVFALLVSIVSVIFNINPQDDVVQILIFWNEGRVPLIAILILLTMVLLIIIQHDRPLKKIGEYFDI